ncbi:MAG: hypothetical protein PCFJNLEI_03537 [Verrucomicrobiae bacterium]|nr:hypothetical protein [Verrucomicrobiae bacterium]
MVRRGFDGKTCWVQARGGALPAVGDQPPVVVVTAQPLLLTGSDVFYGLSEWRSADLGATWAGPVDHSAQLGRRPESTGVEVGICDMTPGWHAATGKLLTTGHTVRYHDDKHPIIASARQSTYSVYDASARTWAPWAIVNLPDRPDFINTGAGCAQRYDLEDGTILLPFSFKPVSDNWHAVMSTTVMRCAFDGRELRYLEHGSELTVPEPRGLCEPSITRFQGRYYLTMRNDVRGYVASGTDGLHFSAPRPWTFDDGTELGSYNTQQHWVTHHERLFLVYTRRGLNNDHVFRHRAPVMMAQVDPDRLVVLRETECELTPNRGARTGNFSVTHVSANETWMFVAEWMQPIGCEKYGSDNTIWAVRIIWNKPNAEFRV